MSQFREAQSRGKLRYKDCSFDKLMRKEDSKNSHAHKNDIFCLESKSLKMW